MIALEMYEKIRAQTFRLQEKHGGKSNEYMSFKIA